MDPNEQLRQMRQARERIRARYAEAEKAGMDIDFDEFDGLNQTDRFLIADMFDELDDWLVRGGFIPSDWEIAKINAALAASVDRAKEARGEHGR